MSIALSRISRLSHAHQPRISNTESPRYRPHQFNCRHIQTEKQSILNRIKQVERIIYHKWASTIALLCGWLNLRDSKCRR